VKRKIICPWSEDDDRRLLTMVEQNRSIRMIGVSLKRTENAITTRLWKLRVAKSKVPVRAVPR
jgi:hypothetical protein